MEHGTRSKYTNDGCRCDACRDAEAEYMRIYAKSHAEERAKYSAEYHKINRLAINSKRRQYDARYQYDIQHRLANCLRSRLRNSLLRRQKVGSAVRDLGCSVEYLYGWIESQFSNGMTWNNWGSGEGKWNIDHIRPLNTFDLEDRDQLLVVCNYKNLRPLWWRENIRRPWNGSDIS
jgi:hypothetical protein